jgi:hypothetical protein
MGRAPYEMTFMLELDNVINFLIGWRLTDIYPLTTKPLFVGGAQRSYGPVGVGHHMGGYDDN